MLGNIHKKNQRNIVESSIVSNYKTIKQNPVFQLISFHHWSGTPRLNPRSSHAKDSKNDTRSVLD